jgi:preprotein translocase subunit SecE
MSNEIRKEINMATTNPFQFIQQVRSEVSKITWPTRREVLLTTIMVFVMSAIAALIFALVDLLIRSGIQSVLNIFG